MQHTFSVLFWLQTQKINKKNGEAPIWARVTVDGKRAEISTGKKTSPDKWNVNSGRIRGEYRGG
ncbi:Arm DNA-binding domain-containing protein [Ekhidna sp.]|uniref:Arm DNA-binding domain-containing protein n=1 Tax=Ekhidna sp. TaxID=2608089 RepID=UPI003299445A